MKFFAAASALVAVASAQSLAGLPSCAQTCALSSISSTGCQLTDFKCICTATSFLKDVQACIGTACSAADQAATITFAQSFCASVGVTIPAPSSGGSSSAASSASASAPAASGSSAAPATTASTAAPAASSAGSVTTLAPVPTTRPSNTTGNATSPPPTQFTGSAALIHGSWVVAAFGAIMAAAL